MEPIYTIDKGVRQIYKLPIADLVTRTSLTVHPENKRYDSRDNCQAVIETATNRLVLGCQATVIPDTVTHLKKRAFAGCKGFKQLHLPASIVTISHDAFEGCPLERITVSPDNPFLDAREDCNAVIRTYDDTLIMGISTTVIPDTVVAINHYAFCNCSGLQSITIPDNVNLLKERAFHNCPDLSEVFLPARLLPVIEALGNRTRAQKEAAVRTSEIGIFFEQRGAYPPPFEIGLQVIFSKCPLINASSIHPFEPETPQPERKRMDWPTGKRILPGVNFDAEVLDEIESSLVWQQFGEAKRRKMETFKDFMEVVKDFIEDFKDFI